MLPSAEQQYYQSAQQTWKGRLSIQEASQDSSSNTYYATWMHVKQNTCQHSWAQWFHLFSDFISLLFGPGGLGLHLPFLALLALGFLLSTPACCTNDSLTSLGDESNSKQPWQDDVIHATAKSCSTNKPCYQSD